MRDFKVFIIVTLCYLALVACLCAVRIYKSSGKKDAPSGIKAGVKEILANKNTVCLFSAIYLFIAMYAVKNVVFRIALMFIYLGFIIKMVKADLESRNK